MKLPLSSLSKDSREKRLVDMRILYIQGCKIKIKYFEARGEKHPYLYSSNGNKTVSRVYGSLTKIIWSDKAVEN